MPNSDAKSWLSKKTWGSAEPFGYQTMLTAAVWFSAPSPTCLKNLRANSPPVPVRLPYDTRHQIFTSRHSLKMSLRTRRALWPPFPMLHQEGSVPSCPEPYHTAGTIGKPSAGAPAGNNPQRAKGASEFSTKSCCFSPPSQAAMPFPAPNVPALTPEVARAGHFAHNPARCWAKGARASLCFP